VESDILRLRTIAHPWAIVRRSPLQSAKHTEEVNVRPPLSDRSLPHQVHKGARSSPAHAHTNTRVRTFTHPWKIVRPRGRLSPVTDLGHFSTFTHHFYNNVLHLIVSWLEYQLLFQDMCFWIQVWGYNIPTSAHSGTPIPLTSFFSSVHTSGTMYDSSLGV
jgi:hypothetical protein